MNDNRRMPYVIVALAAISLLAGGPIAISHYAEATQSYTVMHVQGTGKVICADGSRISNVQLNLQAQVYGGYAGGYFEMVQEKKELYQYGEFYKGQFANGDYRLKGIEDLSMCGGSLVPTTIVIKGNCGFTVDVIFSAANGDRGKFTGNAACVTA